MDNVQIRFDDLWGIRQVSNPNFPDGIKPYIWQDSDDTSWYVYKPTQADYAQLSEVVNSYLAIFQEPTQHQCQRIGQSMG